VDAETQTTCSSSCRSCWRIPDDVILSDPVPVQTRTRKRPPIQPRSTPIRSSGPPNQSRHRLDPEFGVPADY
jgi:hypothetical protein